MIFQGSGAEDREFSGRLWRFGECEFDESSRTLKLHGGAVDLEAKPLEVLYQLLLRAGEVLTKDELLDAVWPGVSVVEGSLATAVSKLRKALADEEQTIILTVPRIGYRLGVAAQWKQVAPPASTELGFQVGDAVPGREQWQLAKAMDRSGSSEVWLGEHPKTHETRVFKFASDGVRLKGLKREVTLARLLKEALGERPEFVRVLEWNFDQAPYYLESEYCGLNLQQWAEERGGLAAIPFETRLRVFVEMAAAVSSAHGVGILHKDLKPANVLIAAKGEDGWQVKVADFGSGSLVEPGRLDAMGITNLGFTQTASGDADLMTGTLMYLPPEVLAGQVPTAAADVYALGVMLYQFAAGDFRKPLSPGWEADVADPLIREDIAEAASGDPAKRMASVATLVERLRGLERRRVERNAMREAGERAVLAERRLAAERARRPWVVAAILALTAGLGFSLYLYGQAQRQTAIAAAVNRFLTNDLLGRTNPFQSGKSAETLVDAVKLASANIERQFADEPEVAARLHQAIAKALDNRSDWEGARREYERTAMLFDKAGSAEEAGIARLQLATMEARTYVKGGLEKAKEILAAEEKKIAPGNAEADVWLASARGMIALIGNDAKRAAEQFQSAYRKAEAMPSFDENARLTMKQRWAFATMRLGDGAKAEQLFRELIAAFTRSSGAESASVLRVRMNLAQAYMVQNKHKEAIAETSSLYPAYVAALGEDHELSLQLLTTRAQSEGSIGLWDDAVRDDLAVYRIAGKKQGPHSFFAVATLSDAALAECRGGHLPEGEKHARQAYEASVKGFGAKAGLTGGTAYTLATCVMGLGKLDEAERLLREIDVKAVAQLAGIAGWGANVDLSRGEIAYRKGDKESAEKFVNVAEAEFLKPDAEAYQRAATLKLRGQLKR